MEYYISMTLNPYHNISIPLNESAGVNYFMASSKIHALSTIIPHRISTWVSVTRVTGVSKTYLSFTLFVVSSYNIMTDQTFPRDLTKFCSIKIKVTKVKLFVNAVKQNICNNTKIDECLFISLEICMLIPRTTNERKKTLFIYSRIVTVPF